MSKLTLQDLALDTARKWQKIWDDGKADPEDIADTINAVINHEVQLRVKSKMAQLFDEQIESIAEKSVQDWLAKGDFIFSQPDEKTLEMASRIFSSESFDKALANSVKKLRAKVFRLRQEGASEDQISGVMQISPGRVKTLLREAEKEAEAIRKLHAAYFGE